MEKLIAFNKYVLAAIVALTLLMSCSMQEQQPVATSLLWKQFSN